MDMPNKDSHYTEFGTTAGLKYKLQIKVIKYRMERQYTKKQNYNKGPTL
jgi:hypothetical protein